MVDRVRIKRVSDEKDAKSEKRRSNLGGRRAGSGRKFGSVNAALRSARSAWSKMVLRCLAMLAMLPPSRTPSHLRKHAVAH